MGDDEGQQARKSQKVCGTQVASQRHVVTEQKRRDKINEGYAELQQLLPCTEKVEKARLLMQAAEYTRQLQAAMQQLVDSDASSRLPDDLQYAIRKLLPPKQGQGSTGGGTAGSSGLNPVDPQDPLALLAEHAQQAQDSEWAEKAAAEAAAAAASQAAAPASAPPLAVPLVAGLLGQAPLLQPLQANMQLIQQLQLQALQGQVAGLPALAGAGLAGVPGLQSLLAAPALQSLLATNLAAGFQPVVAPPAPADPGNEGGTGEGGPAPAKRKAATKARQHSTSAKLAKEENSSPREDAGGRPGVQPT
eukprot:jgi/Botrbrau1/19162/Bobra.0077s0073.2